MIIKIFEESFSVCKVKDYSLIDINEAFVFLQNTDEEKSLVIETDKAPQNVIEKEDGWCMMRIEGILDFSLIGILSKISNILAKEKIGIFVLSSYNTDYIFIKEEKKDKAIIALKKEGYEII